MSPLMPDSNSFNNRNQYIRVGNELNKGVNKDIYIKGNQQKIELDKRLEEISISSNVNVSGTLAKQAVLASSATSTNVTTPNLVSGLVEMESEERERRAKEMEENPIICSTNYEQHLGINMNRTKDFASTLRESNGESMKKFNRFNINN